MSQHSMNNILCSFSNHIFVSSGWLLDLKIERPIRSPPLLLNTSGVCNYDTINNIAIVFFFFSLVGVCAKKTLSFIISKKLTEKQNKTKQKANKKALLIAYKCIVLASILKHFFMLRLTLL